MDRRSPRVTCYLARHAADHPRPFGISEAKLLPALKAEAARFHPPSEVETTTTDEDARRALDVKREGIGDAYAAGAYGKVGSSDAKARLGERLAAIDDAADALDARSLIVAVPEAIDWTWPPRRINTILRAYWERVELGPDLMPIKFAWRPGFDEYLS